MKSQSKIACILMFVVTLSGALSLLQAQVSDATEGAAAQAVVEAPPRSELSDRQTGALKSLAAIIGQTKIEIKELGSQERNAVNSEERARISMQMEDKRVRLAELRREFVGVAAAVDVEDLDASSNEDVSVRRELDALLQPLLSELREATAAPRETEELRRQIASVSDQNRVAEKVVAALQAQLDKTEDKTLKTQLKDSLKAWKIRAGDAKARLEVAEYQFAERDSRERPVLELLSGMFKKFFRSRGLHLMFALLAFGLTFYLVKRGYFLFRKISPLHRKGGTSFSARLFDLGFYVLSFVLAWVVATLYLYLANDWILLTIVILFFLGSFWVGKHAIATVYEQGKLMLNLGSVREGERVVIDGVPWRVDRVHVFAEFTNPLLEGGHLRLPIKDLIDMRSRAFDHEPWFPSEVGDWVLLSDESFGRVTQQTPEHVQMIKLGGNRRFIPTADFLALKPENLSHNFRIATTFGIDYSHQEISTTDVPRILEEAVMKGLLEIIDEDQIKNLSVQFSSAGASSLDYEVLADLCGGVASKFQTLRRAIQRLCVDTCNAEGWIIPFTQLTVHHVPGPVDEG